MIGWLDAQIGRVSLYGLVIACLSAIGITALVLSFLGQLTATPLELGASAAVLLVTTVAVGAGFGAIFRIRPHHSSSIITALLLFFVLSPVVDPVGLAWLALCGAVAAASKYLLAIRGRHVFNPAAIAVVLIGYLGPAYPSWWVGSAALFPIVTIAAALVLFRTRQFALGGVYVLVAAGITIVLGLIGGSTIDVMLSLALLSSPTVFVAGFMLSEPQTLPPRRRQRLVLAALVGALSVVPFSIGPVYNTPQLALVIGNLLAFFTGARRRIRLTFLDHRQLSPTSWEYRFAPGSPVRFLPGQYLELSLAHGGSDKRGWRRVFSIASAPGEPIAIATRIPARPSSFKNALAQLEPGAALSATTVAGDFVAPRKRDEPLLLIAAGIGLTPFVSWLRADELSGSPGSRDVVFVAVASSTEELLYAEELAGSGWRLLLVSPSAPEPSGPWTWLGEGPLTPEIVHSAVPDARDRRAYLSGAPTLVTSLKRALHRSGIRPVHTDVFVGY